MKVKKAVIPAAGLGTRFLPATKAQPKEMLPIVDKPAIQYIVEEALHSGIESLIIVTGRNKKSIEDHFDKNMELEQLLREKGKLRILEEITTISGVPGIHFIRQKEPLGLGHAILCAQQFIGDEPFAVLLGDDIIEAPQPALRQLLDVYEQSGSSVIGVKQVARETVNKYGIIKPGDCLAGVYDIRGLVEKPQPEQAPSNLAIVGRYVLNPDIFGILSRIERGAGGEYQLTDALHELNKQQTMLALELEGDRYDIGDKFGYIQAVLEIGLRREELKPLLLPYLNELVRNKIGLDNVISS
ncbi:UTP--glucose-1-phosphate uridylyltransferase GalU [Paenibacillus physcomitrellae]|uniref:UTP--glucose-1-phosphate uridylyltransferase n=1 Tax=Paenibacillus physcomitrellae TaxID=1619311 RepID=A0ABQ1GKP6_9BACL|nr:UTP--glucose-1-phosphate uridylyltransferase GalU [Paenibacillus physcomitrellae]GGA45428.1 putative UTP--glucose-1-phosphate uridylyltransferase YngB [Paenibacillus physcomitrellae]